MSSHGRVLWTELNTHHVEKAKTYYAATFGWAFQAMPLGTDGTYWLGKPDGSEMAVIGIFEMSGPYFAAMPDHWLTYFGVDDIDARLSAVPGLGGEVVRPAWDIPNVGRIAIVRGASGAVEGWLMPPPGMVRS